MDVLGYSCNSNSTWKGFFLSSIYPDIYLNSTRSISHINTSVTKIPVELKGGQMGAL